MRWRIALIVFFLGAGLVALIWRMVDLSIIHRDFLVKQSRLRTVRAVEIPAHRGMITDRHGTPLAISTPLYSVWINPKLYKATQKQQHKLADYLQDSPTAIQRRIKKHAHRAFIYLKRNITPDVAEKVKALSITGLFFKQEYQRYYPEGAVTAHVLGLTNIDDRGQEGLELAYDNWLRGSPGKRLVVKDRLGHVVAALQRLSVPVQGHNLTLSIDQRIQYLAFRALQWGVARAHAKSGSAVVLDAKTGEVLAMVNQPSFNPNKHPRHKRDGRYRNRTVTDLFEPGSTIKAFSIASALESGHYFATTKINTNPGRLMVEGHPIIDEHINYGVITVSQVLQKSSNIGTAKMILSLPPENLVDFLEKMGFGQETASHFPGEVSGSLPRPVHWRPFELATLSFGYGLAVTNLQMAQAYAVLANEGAYYPVTLIKRDNAPVTGQRVISKKTARAIVAMLAKVTERGGTGYRARVAGYRVAGKTGTAYIAEAGGYNKHRYIASFVGLAPVDHPRFVVAVVVREPSASIHYGGLVAAPIFANIMGGVLRLSDVL